MARSTLLLCAAVALCAALISSPFVGAVVAVSRGRIYAPVRTAAVVGVAPYSVYNSRRTVVVGRRLTATAPAPGAGGCRTVLDVRP